MEGCKHQVTLLWLMQIIEDVRSRDKHVVAVAVLFCFGGDFFLKGIEGLVLH